MRRITRGYTGQYRAPNSRALANALACLRFGPYFAYSTRRVSRMTCTLI